MQQTVFGQAFAEQSSFSSDFPSQLFLTGQDRVRVFPFFEASDPQRSHASSPVQPDHELHSQISDPHSFSSKFSPSQVFQSLPPEQVRDRLVDPVSESLFFRHLCEHGSHSDQSDQLKINL